MKEIGQSKPQGSSLIKSSHITPPTPTHTFFPLPHQPLPITLYSLMIWLLFTSVLPLMLQCILCNPHSVNGLIHSFTPPVFTDTYQDREGRREHFYESNMAPDFLEIIVYQQDKEKLTTHIIYYQPFFKFFFVLSEVLNSPSDDNFYNFLTNGGRASFMAHALCGHFYTTLCH